MAIKTKFLEAAEGSPKVQKYRKPRDIINSKESNLANFCN